MTDKQLVRQVELNKLTINELKEQPAAVLAEEVGKLRSCVVGLGDSNVFVKKGPGGDIVAFKANVALRKDLDQFCFVSGKAMVTGKGYHRLLQFTGASVFTPATLTINDGSKVPNPYLVYHEKNGRPSTQLRAVVVRKVVVGHSPTGILSSSDDTFTYDLDNYLMSDLYAVILKFPDCGKVLPELAIKTLTEEQLMNSIMIPFLSNTILVADLGHKEVSGVLKNHTQKLRFAGRNAATICLRRACEQHPAFGVSRLVPETDQLAMVPIVGWKSTLTREDLHAMEQTINEDRPIDADTVVGSGNSDPSNEADAIDIEGTIAAESVDMSQKEREEFEAERAPEPEKAKKPDAKPHPDPERTYAGASTLKQRNDVLNKLFDKDKVKRAVNLALDDLGIPGDLSECSTKEKAQVLDKAYDLLCEGV